MTMYVWTSTRPISLPARNRNPSPPHRPRHVRLACQVSGCVRISLGVPNIVVAAFFQIADAICLELLLRPQRDWTNSPQIDSCLVGWKFSLQKLGSFKGGIFYAWLVKRSYVQARYCRFQLVLSLWPLRLVSCVRLSSRFLAGDLLQRLGPHPCKRRVLLRPRPPC